MHPLTDTPPGAEGEMIPLANVRVRRRVQCALRIIFETLGVEDFGLRIARWVLVDGVDVADDACAAGDAVAHVFVVSSGSVRDAEDKCRSPAEGFFDAGP